MRPPLAGVIIGVALAGHALAASDPCKTACKSAKQSCVASAKATFATDRGACTAVPAGAERRSCKQLVRGDFAFAKGECKRDKVACVAACAGGASTTTTLPVGVTTTTRLSAATTTTTTPAGGPTTTTTLPGPSCGDAEAVALRGVTSVHDAVRADPSLFANGMTQPAPDPALGPLCYSSEVAAIAQAWADLCQYMHNPGRGLGVGENIYAEAGPGTGGARTPADAVELWSAEAEFFDHATNTCDAPDPPGTCGHYTQVVWRDTDSLGCGLRTCTVNSPFPGFTTWTFVVCNYAPAGNVTVCAPPAGCEVQKPY